MDHLGRGQNWKLTTSSWFNRTMSRNHFINIYQQRLPINSQKINLELVDLQ